MKSRISIDLDESNNPIIKIEYAASDDVRDKMVKRFLEGFGGSKWAKFHFMPQTTSTQNNSAVIWPICGYDIPEECETMKIEAEMLLKAMAQIKEGSEKSLG